MAPAGAARPQLLILGSRDAALREISANPVAEFVSGQPQLCAIGFNGLTAARIGRRALGEASELSLIDLPSSSPAHMPGIAAKAARWSMLANFARAATLAR